MQSSTIVCALHVSDKTVELLVMRDDPAWRWEVWFTGQRLDVGEAETRVAAQWACVRASYQACRTNSAGFHRLSLE